MKIALATAFLALTSGAALAEEQPIQLKNAPGRDVVEQNCGACHSLDYIKMNSPFLKPDGWNAEVTKMINAYGAPIAQDDAKKIQDYLVQNYGG
jgi:mono/diheme cytochrome c family protein